MTKRMVVGFTLILFGVFSQKASDRFRQKMLAASLVYSVYAVTDLLFRGFA